MHHKSTNSSPLPLPPRRLPPLLPVRVILPEYAPVLGKTGQHAAALILPPVWITGFLGCLLTVPEFAFSAAHTWSQPPPCVTNVGSGDGPIYSSLRVKKSHLAALSLLQDDSTDLGKVVSSGVSQEFAAYLQPDLSDDPICMTITDVQPHILKAKSDKCDPDNPSWSQAMNSSDADKWWEAMSTEMETLEVDLKAWRLVEREPWMNP
eukprot:CCRYP_000648-RA/>CCRYP_000648-RA protein AED:0.75 eAED:0.51 QI:0/0/0/0.5/1/1/2/0/206